MFSYVIFYCFTPKSGATKTQVATDIERKLYRGEKTIKEQGSGIWRLLLHSNL